MHEYTKLCVHIYVYKHFYVTICIYMKVNMSPILMFPTLSVTTFIILSSSPYIYATLHSTIRNLVLPFTIHLLCSTLEDVYSFRIVNLYIHGKILYQLEYKFMYSSLAFSLTNSTHFQRCVGHISFPQLFQ